jgi:iron complex outermembrane recepter protein
MTVFTTLLYRCFIFLALIGLGGSSLLAQQDTTSTGKPPAAVTKGTQKLDELSIEELLNVEISVGTRGDDRKATESLVPIDVVTAAELAKTGFVELGQALQATLPAANFYRPSIVDASDHTYALTLRGMSPDQVLVLVNGKRYHNSAITHVSNTIGRGAASVDVNTIPISCVERVEVLRDGAAAQYGSDAIAGIINIVLKSRASGEIAGSLGANTSVPGMDGRTVQAAVSTSFAVGTDGYIFIGGEFRDRAPASRAGSELRQQFFPNDPRNNNSLLTNRPNVRYGPAAATDAAFVYNASLPLAPATSFYSSGVFNYRHGESGGFFRRANENRNVRAIYPNGFLPLIRPDLLDASATLGLQSEIDGWKFDVSSTLGYNSFQFTIANSLNASLGAASKTTFDCGGISFLQSTSNLDIFKSFSIGLPSPLKLGIGAEFRLENYRIRPGEADSYRDGGVRVLDGPALGAETVAGAQVFPGFQPSNATDKSRNNISAYIDIEQSLLTNLTIGVAARFEQFSDFGSTLNGKVALRYEAVKGVVLRGSASTGFRAPALQQSFFTSIATNTIGGVATQVGTFAVDNAVALQVGAIALKPEQSRHLSAGVAVEPLQNLTLSADYFYVDIRDRIVFSGNFTATSAPTFAPLLRANNIGGVRYFRNAVDTRTQGGDLNARYTLTFEPKHTLLFQAGLNLNQTSIVGDVKAEPALQNLVFDRIERNRFENGQPRTNLNLSIQYRFNDLAVTVRTICVGEFTVFSRSDNEATTVSLTTTPNPGYTPAVYAPATFDQTYAAQWLTDMQIMYSFGESLRVAVGGNNIFNTYPDKTLSIPGDFTTGIIQPYSNFSPFGFTGAAFYIRAMVKL